MRTIFKIGDKVYHFQYGWGVINAIRDNTSITYPIIVDFLYLKNVSFTLDGRFKFIDIYPSLSFTEYDFINGGFSQVRLLPDIKKDQLIYVKSCEDGEWTMRYFSHFDKKGRIICFNAQKKSTEGYNIIAYPFYSIENPLL